MGTALDLADVQGNILNGYGSHFGHAVHLLLHADTAEAARQCLQQVQGRVTTAARWSRGHRPRTTLNVGVTYSGFQRLELRPSLLDRFPEAFREGPSKRAADLGDTGLSSPDEWEEPLGAGHVHLLLTICAQTPDDLSRAWERLRDELGSITGLAVVAEQETHALPRRREHFGFADGFSQPEIEGVDRPSSHRPTWDSGIGVPLPGGRWRPIKAGEFLLGRPDEDGQIETEPDPELVRNGTYVVYRKLRQDVQRFEESLTEAARRTGLPRELVAAKIMGRWRDGISLATESHRGDPGDLTEVANDQPANDFRYLPDDREGHTCPLGAHIRRANPRDALDFGGTLTDSGVLTARHRIIRRGMPYEETSGSGSDDRGLLFVCYQADIARQYETVQKDWCNDGDTFGLGDDPDYLFGRAGSSGKMAIPMPDGRPRFVDVPPDLVVTRGTEYLFAPGIGALRKLAEGAFG
ncbi:Dyp-type peroxidase [Geodermatophilus sp. URMC 61]|uniref:Dyp-type peroxidase n=1 Tax=Geodermatophilus sp. URMC 61 TaxID=3423411 RepID=UPI00406CE005